MARILCFDYGVKRIGVAVTDELKIISSPHDTIPTSKILTFISEYISQNSVEKSVWNKELYDKYDEKNFIKFENFDNIIDVKNIDYPLLHAAVFYCTNIERVKRGLKPLKWNLNLEIAAYNHCKDMVKRNFFDHLSKKKVEKRRCV